MGITRREWIKIGVASFCVLTARARATERADMKNANRDWMGRLMPLDYGRSFVCHAASFNAVRFWIESRTRIIDEQSGICTDFYPCASCKSEDTFAERNLFFKDNYDFLPIFGGDDVLVFRRPAGLSKGYRQIKKAEKMWGAPILKLRRASSLTELSTWEQIRDATAQALPIATQTEIANAETGLRAIIECPTKTMNVSLEKKKYQVDTGPVAFPDLSKRYEPAIACLSLAFIAFNAPDFADFIVEQPTPVIENGQEKCKLYHYSNPFSLPATNRLFALSKA